MPCPHWAIVLNLPLLRPGRRAHSSSWDCNTAAATRPALKSWLITFGNANNPGATFSFIGFVTDFSVKGAMDSAVTASISVKISGSVTFTNVS